MEPRFLVDSYMEWVEAEGIPIVEGFGVDLLSIETGKWPRLGVQGAYVHLFGRGDFLNLYVCEIPPGQATAPQRNLFEQVIYVLDGRGSTTVETEKGVKHSFEWGAGSLFAIPLNTRYRLFNGSGSAPARLASVTNLPLMMNLFHSQDFLLENDWVFSERMGDDGYFRGGGKFIPVRPGKHMWETNFVPDLHNFELHNWEERGGSNIIFILADSVMHSHMSEMPVGTYKKAHRHGPEYHVFPVTGHGYSLFWYEGKQDVVRVDWKHGWVYAPPDMMFHQHFNTAPFPSRYIAAGLGSLRYPLTADKRAIFQGIDVSVKDGGLQIEFSDEDPRVHRTFEEELTKHGVDCAMHKLHVRA